MSDALLSTDFLIIGAGMAGMTAAGRAAQLGATVIVVEKADRIGGSAGLSEGYIWTAPSMEVLVDEDPSVNREQGKVLLHEVGPALEWARGLGVQKQAGLTAMLGFGVGAQIDMHAFLAKTRAMVEGNGGYVLVGCLTSLPAAPLRRLADFATSRP